MYIRGLSQAKGNISFLEELGERITLRVSEVIRKEDV